MKITDILKNFGYNNDLHTRALSKINDWRSWYIGFNKYFHEYQVYNGKSKIRQRRLSMQMAKKACEDWADILFNINCKVSLEDESSDAEFQKLLSKNDFWIATNQAVEKAFAVGTVGIVLSVEKIVYDPESGKADMSNAEPHLEIVDADKIYPLSWRCGKCTECAFVTHSIIREKKYATVSIHYLDDRSRYVIENRIFEETANGDIIEIENENDILGAFRRFETDSEKAWFCLITPAICKNMADTYGGYMQDMDDYPFGQSVYANAIDSIKALDIAFDSLSNEITIGRKRIFVGENMLEDVDGNKVFDASDISVYYLPKGLNSDDLLQPESSELRVESIVKALQTDLSAFSQNIGMGRDVYSFDVSSMATAAQVYSTNSELKRKRDKHKTKLENELIDILDAFIYAANTFSGYNIDPDGLSIQFDDSLFEDEGTKAERKMQEINIGVSSRAEYRETIFGEDEATAKKRIADIDQEEQETMMPNHAMKDDETETDTENVADANEVIEDAEQAKGTALNGAQTQSLLVVMQQLSDGKLTESQAVNIVATAVGITKDKAREIIRGE